MINPATSDIVAQHVRMGMSPLPIVRNCNLKENIFGNQILISTSEFINKNEIICKSKVSNIDRRLQNKASIHLKLKLIYFINILTSILKKSSFNRINLRNIQFTIINIIIHYQFFAAYTNKCPKDMTTIIILCLYSQHKTQAFIISVNIIE